MIDQAANDVVMGLNYLDHHTIHHHDDCAVFLKDALHALELSKSLSQNGYQAAPFLANVQSEIKRSINDLHQ